MSNILEKRKDSLVFSHRFIDKCIDERSIVNIDESQYIHLFPLTYKIPLEDMSNIVVHFFSSQKKEQIILENVMEILGAKCDLSKKTTHIVCNKINDQQKEKFQKNFNKNILFVSSEWIIECLLIGGRYKEDKFLL